MKKEYSKTPDSMKNMETYGFSWMDFVTAIPSPLFVVTTYHLPHDIFADPLRTCHSGLHTFRK